jgi:hypothetical protein
MQRLKTIMMCLMLTIVELITCQPGEYQTGWASQYGNGGVMEATIEAQQDMGHIPQDLSGYDGFVAVLDCARVGDTVYMRPSNQAVWERFMVVDCACSCHPSTIAWMQDNNIIAEVDYQTAERWETVGSGIRVNFLESVK